jgi:DNA-directed RNA polymerase beta' subunit
MDYKYLRLYNQLVRVNKDSLTTLHDLLTMMKAYLAATSKHVEDYLVKDLVEDLYKTCEDYQRFLSLLDEIFNIPFKIITGDSHRLYDDIL